jgi:formate-dependent nitrite reductase cytochrome c552 subunit
MLKRGIAPLIEEVEHAFDVDHRQASKVNACKRCHTDEHFAGVVYHRNQPWRSTEHAFSARMARMLSWNTEVLASQLLASLDGESDA